MPSREESLCGQLDRLNNKELEKENDERKDGQNELTRSPSKKLVFKQKVPSHVFEALALQDQANPLRPAAACSNLTKEEEEQDEEANKVKGSLKAIGLMLKTRPNLGKHATEADGKEMKGNTKKKWPKVEIGLGSEHATKWKPRNPRGSRVSR